jgi:hypothetical protein
MRHTSNVIKEELMPYAIDRTKAHELRELIEDTVEHFCDENMVSGELTWIMVQCLAEAKLTELKKQL